MDFACPKCKEKLLLDGNTKKCINNHCFDRAKAGYYNLLLGVGGGTHGDKAEMVEARRAFLSRGYYEPLADKLAALVTDHVVIVSSENNKLAVIADRLGSGIGPATVAVVLEVAREVGGNNEFLITALGVEDNGAYANLSALLVDAHHLNYLVAECASVLAAGEGNVISSELIVNRHRSAAGAAVISK